MNLRTAVLSAAISAATAFPVLAGQATSPLLFDRDLTVGAGATIAATLGEALARAEDAVVPQRLFAERGMFRRSANVTFRWMKLALFDAPQERVLMVANHEVFGHGARLRERFDGPIGYRIDLPPPYGRGGGSTSFVFDRQPTHHDLLAIDVAGMEANGVAAGIAAHGAFSRGRIRVRDALRYLAFELDTFSYILRTDDEGEEPGHDVAGFLDTYNALAVSAGAATLTARTLRREALVSLANPMLAYALVGIGRYVWNGATDVGVPALSIAGIRYLPILRYRLTPYGTEWSIMNELGGRLEPMQIEVRIGRSPQATPWGIGARRRRVASWLGWGIDASVEVWRQPRITGTVNEALTTDTHLGAQLRGRAERPLIPLWFGSAPATIIIDVGLKSAGFVPGDPLRGGAVARAGLGLPLGP